MIILLIDGEYLKRAIPLKDLKDFITSAFGIINYPNKIIYYSASIDEQQTKVLNKIKNLKINNKGYISLQNRGEKKVQKAVDGYIIADMMEYLADDLYIIAGDGDLIAPFEKKYSRHNEKINLICRKNSVSKNLLNLSTVYYIDEIKNSSLRNLKEEIESTELNENELNLKKLWDKERDNNGWLSGSKIGQKRKEYGFKYTKGSLNKILKCLEKRNLIKLKPENGDKTLGYNIKFLIQ